LTSARSRAARELMAETGWNYTRALGEINRRRAVQQEDEMGKHDKNHTPAPTQAGPLSAGGPVAGQAAETRGGQAPDWENARPGEPLPQLPEENDDPDAP
jgi:hypothetical protein